MQTEKQKIGELGENIACKFLMKHGHEILDRNYRKKWGEIDIVAQKEVKTVSRETEHMPEENVHPWKRKRLARAIQTYLLEKESETEWQIDIMAVFLDFNSKKPKLRITKNVIL